MIFHILFLLALAAAPSDRCDQIPGIICPERPPQNQPLKVRKVTEYLRVSTGGIECSHSLRARPVSR